GTQQSGVPARGGRIRRIGALHSKAREVVGSASLWSGSRQPLPSKRLLTYDRANLIAVDVNISDPHALTNCSSRRLDAAMDCQRKAIPGRVNGVADVAQSVSGETYDMQHWSEHLA